MSHICHTLAHSGSGTTGEKAAKAMHAIADAVTQCKFEATNPAADEVVLYKILQVVSASTIHTHVSLYVIVKGSDLPGMGRHHGY